MNEMHPIRDTQPRKRKVRYNYSPQFKEQALERAAKEKITHVAKELGLTPALLYSWRAKLAREQGRGLWENHQFQHAKVEQLKRENAHLKEEITFLKKVAMHVTKDLK